MCTGALSPGGWQMSVNAAFRKGPEGLFSVRAWPAAGTQGCTGWGVAETFV